MIENDETRYVATPAIVIANVRTGGTFLAHCLSNHTQVFFCRSEALHHMSIWHRSFTLNRIRVLEALTHQPGYQVSGCKMLYQQAFKCEVWTRLLKMQPHVIWLTRENVIRQAVSAMINKRARLGLLKRPEHTFAEPATLTVELKPEEVLKTARRLAMLDKHAAEKLGHINKVMGLTYEQITGGQVEAAWLPKTVGQALCKFVGIPYQRMGCELRRVNRAPLHEMVSNWSDVEALLRASEFVLHLEREAET